MDIRRVLGVLLGVSAVAAAESEYADANRRILYQAPDAALGYSALAFIRDGAPNTNPAVLALDSTFDVRLTYAGYFRNTYSNTLLSSVIPVGRSGAVGVSLSYLYVPDILVTWGWPTDGDGNPIVPPESQWEYGSQSETYVHIAYGHQWRWRSIRASAGVALNALRRRLPAEGEDWTGYGIGLDAGAGVEFEKPGIRIGLYGENITTSYMNWSDDYDEQVYPHARLALGWQRDIPYIYGAVQLSYTSPDLLGNEGINASNALSSSDTTETPRELRLSDEPWMVVYGNYGLEYRIAEVVALRVGVENLRRFTFGAGVALWKKRLLLDFAYLPHELSGSYLVSLGYRW